MRKAAGSSAKTKRWFNRMERVIERDQMPNSGKHIFVSDKDFQNFERFENMMQSYYYEASQLRAKS